MSGIQVFEFDSSRLHSADDVTQAVHAIYRELRQRRRVVAVVATAPEETRKDHASRLLAHALDEAGVPHAIAASPASSVSMDSAECLLRDVPVLVIARSKTHIEEPKGTDPFLPSPSESRYFPCSPLRIVLLGLGTVRLGVFCHLTARPDQFDVRRVVVRDPTKHRNDGVPAGRLSTNLWHAVNEPADVVIELIGGIDPAADVVRAALLRG